MKARVLCGPMGREHLANARWSIDWVRLGLTKLFWIIEWASYVFIERRIYGILYFGNELKWRNVCGKVYKLQSIFSQFLLFSFFYFSNYVLSHFVNLIVINITLDMYIDILYYNVHYWCQIFHHIWDFNLMVEFCGFLIFCFLRHERWFFYQLVNLVIGI